MTKKISKRNEFGTFKPPSFLVKWFMKSALYKALYHYDMNIVTRQLSQSNIADTEQNRMHLYVGIYLKRLNYIFYGTAILFVSLIYLNW